LNAHDCSRALFPQNYDYSHSFAQKTALCGFLRGAARREKTYPQKSDSIGRLGASILISRSIVFPRLVSFLHRVIQKRTTVCTMLHLQTFKHRKMFKVEQHPAEREGEF
jgi:hypothetical protein